MESGKMRGRPVSTEPNRVQMTIRLKESDKAFFQAGAEMCGLEAGVAVRQIVELVVQRMRAGGDYIDALHELRRTWAPHIEETPRSKGR